MKKFLLCLFSFLFISTATIGGGLIFAGCNQTHFEQAGGISQDENLGDDENAEIEKPNDDISPQVTYYYFFGGARIIDTANPGNWSSTGGGTDWFHQTPNKSPNGGYYSQAWVDFGGTFYNNFSGYYGTFTITEMSIDVQFMYTKVSSLKFLGWWTYSWNDNGSDGGEESVRLVSSEDIYRTTLYGEYSSYLPSEGSIIFAMFCDQVVYNNTYYYRTISGSISNEKQEYAEGETFKAFDQYNLSDEYNSFGWEIYGWSLSSSSVAMSYLSGKNYTSNENLVLYAISRRTITINYNANGGSNTPSSSTGTQYWNQYGNVYNTKGLTIKSGEPTRTGYTFLGWSTRQTAITPTYTAGDTYTFSYNTSNTDTLYAVWEINQYYFDVNVNVNDISYGTGGIAGFTFDLYRNGGILLRNQRDYYQLQDYDTEM